MERYKRHEKQTKQTTATEKQTKNVWNGTKKQKQKKQINKQKRKKRIKSEIKNNNNDIGTFRNITIKQTEQFGTIVAAAEYKSAANSRIRQ